jgi:hypothetical protein
MCRNQTGGLERPGDQLMRSMAVIQASLIYGIKVKSDMSMQHRMYPRIYISDFSYPQDLNGRLVIVAWFF